MCAACKTSPKAAVNLVSRSRIRNLIVSSWPSRSISKLRACWVTHAPAGCGVMPRTRMRLLACSITARTQPVVPSRKPTVKKPAAKMATAGERRNWPTSARPGAAPGRAPPSSAPPTPSTARCGCQGRPAHRESCGSPTPDSRGPDEAPGRRHCGGSPGAQAVCAGTWLPSVGEQYRDASAAPYPGSRSSAGRPGGRAGSHRALPRSAPGPPRKASAAPRAAAAGPRAGGAAAGSPRPSTIPRAGTATTTRPAVSPAGRRTADT